MLVWCRLSGLALPPLREAQGLSFWANPHPLHGESHPGRGAQIDVGGPGLACTVNLPWARNFVVRTASVREKIEKLGEVLS
jgi:hypothetical protein